LNEKCTQCGKQLGLDYDGREPVEDPIREGSYCHPFCWYLVVTLTLKAVVNAHE